MGVFGRGLDAWTYGQASLEASANLHKCQVKRESYIRGVTNLCEGSRKKNKNKQRAVLPLTILTDNLGVVQERDRGEVHCTSAENPDADEWKNVFQALRKMD